MSEAGVFGASKAGAVTDPMAYLRKPSVVFRIGALVSYPGRGATSDTEHGTLTRVVPWQIRAVEQSTLVNTKPKLKMYIPASLRVDVCYDQ